MKKLLLIGGDKRSLEVIHLLSEKGYQVAAIGFDKLEFSNVHVDILQKKNTDFSQFDAIILPVQGAGNDGIIDCPYSDDTFQLTEKIIHQTTAHCKILTGITNEYLDSITTHRKLEVIFARDDIAIYNSIPTAEATLQIAIEQTDYTIHGSNIAVLGYGRVGFTVAKLFKQVGANVAVFARQDRDLARITEMGMQAMNIAQLEKNSESFSILVNTIPQLILDETILNQLQKGTLIIDLASKPGGTDFEHAEQLGINAIHALGLPGKSAPKTAGKVLAETILKLI